MGRFWSLLFLSVPVLGVLCFALAMADVWPMQRHWLPENIAAHGHVIDNLFMFILYLTGAIFVATGVVLFWFLWKYDGAVNTEPVKYIHGDHVLEVVWSIVPAATLLFIAFYQMDAWASQKMWRPEATAGGAALDADLTLQGESDVARPVHYKAPIAEVVGRQFEWRIRYPGADGIYGTIDDIHTVNELALPEDEELVLRVNSEDVLHSFFLPNARIKQDVVPGMVQHVWFKPTKRGRFDIVCAELCGWGHYKMKGRMTIMSRGEYEQWKKDTFDAQERAYFIPPEPAED